MWRLLDAEREPTTSIEGEVAGMPVCVPMLDIHTAGAGGGSLAWIDAAGVLQVGPQSAGADPGPACYGHGDGATVTDANVVLGRLHPEHFLGGAMRLDGGRARSGVEQIRASGGFDRVEDLAEGMVRVANAAHGERACGGFRWSGDYDPRDFTLLAFGGAGPLHACALASALGIRRVLVPPAPGALSAFGILDADLRREFSRTVMLAPGSPQIARVFGNWKPRHGRPFALKARGRCYHARPTCATGAGLRTACGLGRGSRGSFPCAARAHYGYADPARDGRNRDPARAGCCARRA